MIERLAAGLLLSVLVSALGWRYGALSASGAVAAVGVGTAVVIGTSWPGILVLGAFFVSSSLISQSSAPGDLAAKGSQRDVVQVLANGGVAAGAALLVAPFDALLGFAMLAGSLAAATADTWATELGSRFGSEPRMLVSRRPVNVGESGGVSSAGLLASAAGSILIAAVAGISGALWLGVAAGPAIFVVVLNAGVVGSLLDSLAGELVQERRYCPVCARLTEARVHQCGTRTDHQSGVSGITNDVVNVVCTLGGALIGTMILFF